MMKTFTASVLATSVLAQSYDKHQKTYWTAMRDGMPGQKAGYSLTGYFETYLESGATVPTFNV